MRNPAKPRSSPGLLRLVRVEHVRAVAHRPRLAVDDFEDVDAVLEQVAAMEELHGELAAVGAPQRLCGIEAQRLVGGVVEVPQRVRQRGVRRLVWFQRQLAGEVADHLGVERGGGRRRGGRCRFSRCQSKSRHQREQIAAVNDGMAPCMRARPTASLRWGQDGDATHCRKDRCKPTCRKTAWRWRASMTSVCQSPALPLFGRIRRQRSRV